MIEDNKMLKLTEWEVANLHLPPVTTVTLYEGDAPVAFLRSRIARIVEKNPWLTARIVKKNTKDGVVALAYSNNFDLERAVDQLFKVYKPEDVGFSLGMPYEEIVHCLLSVQSARSKVAMDKDEVLFKVAVVPIQLPFTESAKADPIRLQSINPQCAAGNTRCPTP